MSILDMELLRAQADEAVRRIEMQLLEIERLANEVERLTDALTNAKAVASDRIADLEKICRDVMAERDKALLHMHGEVDRLQDEVERLRAAEVRVRELVEPWTTNPYMCGDKPSAGRDVLRALDGQNDQEPCDICSGYGCSDCREDR